MAVDELHAEDFGVGEAGGDGDFEVGDLGLGLNLFVWYLGAYIC